MTKLEKIKRIAVKVRKAFEEIEEKESYGDCYSKNLGGYCLRASVQLYNILKRKNYNITIEEGLGHYYNKFGSYIIDITATQFGNYPKIFIKRYVKPPEQYQKICGLNNIREYINSYKSDEKIVLKYFTKEKEKGNG